MTRCLISQVPSNSYVQITEISGDATEVKRLEALGLYKDRRVRIVKGGFTSIVAMESGNRICIRASAKLNIFCDILNGE